MRTVLLTSILGAMISAQWCCAADSMDTWTLRSSSLPATTWLYGITYGNGQFVAVGGPAQIGGGAGVIITSPDGSIWFPQTIPNDTRTLLDVAFGDGLYVAVGNSRPLASPDGESWTASLSGTSFSTVTYGNGMFVAAGGYIYISTNGSIWKLSSSAGFETYLTSAAYGNGQFVAAASGMYPGLSTFYFSTNGVVWKPRFSGAGVKPFAVSYGNGLFVAVGAGGLILTSSDGVSWTQRNSGTSSNLLGVAYVNTVFVAVGSGGTLLTSSDSANWTLRASGTTNDLTAVAYGNGHFVAVGANGTILVQCPLNPFKNTRRESINLSRNKA